MLFPSAWPGGEVCSNDEAMTAAASFRSLLKQIAPQPVARLARKMLLWQRRAQFRPYNITKTIAGESFSFCIADETGELWYRGEQGSVYEELAFIRDHMLSPNDLVFDVGAHHGLHTICMARHAARVVSIEPNPHNVAVLKQNIRLNLLDNVAIRQVAVGASPCKIKLLQDSDQGGVVLREAGISPTVDVELLTLDQLAHDHGFPQLLKIDVEGFEAAVLRGAAQVLQTRPKIAIEIHVDWVSRYGSSVPEVVNLLNLKSYRAWVLPFNSKLEAWNGKDFSEYPQPKFMVFLLP